MPKAIGIYREIEMASKPAADKIILDLTAKELKKKGFKVSTIFPSQFIKDKVGDTRDFDLIFTMAREVFINDYLSLIREYKNVFMINSPAAIRVSFNRFLTYEKVAKAGVRTPKFKVYNINDIRFTDIKGRVFLRPLTGHEVWFMIDKEFHFKEVIKIYKDMGIKELMVQEFIKGEDLKFYAIGEKVIIPEAYRKIFPEKTVKEIEKNVLAIEKTSGLKILGGDFVIDPKDNYKVYCVDINDWPSFGAMKNFSQKKAGVEIADLIISEFKKFKK